MTAHQRSLAAGREIATDPGAASLGSVALVDRLTLTVAQAAQICGVSKGTVYKWIAAGLPTIPHMAETRIARTRLEAFIAEVAA